MSTSSKPPAALPNPFTPMAFLPPEVAFQFTVKAYVAVGTTAVFVWDVVNSLSADYKLLTRYPPGIPIATYLLSRISTLIYVVACTIFDTAPVKDCSRLGRFVDWFVIAVVASTSLLFVLRVWAVFSHNRYIFLFFLFTWLSVIGATSAIGFGLRGSANNIGTTTYCMYTHTTPYISVSFIAPFVHDTLIFAAITFRLMQNTASDSYTLRQGMRMAVFGDYLPAFSRALLRDGQVYYLTTLVSGLLTVIIFYLPFPPAYKILFTLPNITITNMLACRVYRNAKFGRYSEGNLPTMELRFSISEFEARSHGSDFHAASSSSSSTQQGNNTMMVEVKTDNSEYKQANAQLTPSTLSSPETVSEVNRHNLA